MGGAGRSKSEQDPSANQGRAHFGATRGDCEAKNLTNGPVQLLGSLKLSARFDIGRRTAKISSEVIKTTARAPMMGRARLMNHSNFTMVRFAFCSRRFLSKSLAAMASKEFAEAAAYVGI